MPLQPPDPQARTALATWDAEGGASPGAATSATAEQRLLQSLGAAVVLQWGRLSMPTQRALYDHAVALSGPAGDTSAKRDMAIFLHKSQGGLS